MQSPQTNIVEALLFSAKLRINGEIEKDTLEAYVDEVMDLVELTAIKGSIVRRTPTYATLKAVSDLPSSVVHSIPLPCCNTDLLAAKTPSSRAHWMS